MKEKLEGKKILIYIYDLKTGNGIAKCIMNYFDCLIKKGATVHFLLNSYENSEFAQRVLASGVSIFSLPENTSKPKKKNIEFIHKILKSGYDIIHVNSSGFYALQILRFAKKNRTPVRIYHAHNPREKRSTKVLLRELLYVNPSIHNANFYAACSNNAGNSVYGHKNYMVIYNAMNLDEYKYDSAFRSMFREEFKLSDKFVVGVVGRMEKQKNPYKIIDVFYEFHRKKPNAVLLWAGDGGLKENIVQYIKKKKLEDYIILLGIRKDVNKLYSVMDILLLPSLFEGLGLVFVEAQTSGLECFGSDNVPEDVAVSEKMHFYPLEWSNEQWAQAMISETKKECDRNSTYWVVKNSKFDMKQMENSLTDFYTDCLNHV